jgi:hypothetical protein
MTCFACEEEPTQQCPRCGRPYCDDHGDEYCDACMHPASGLPSFTLYRGSLLALLIGTALAIWLLVQPNKTEGESALRPVVLTPTAAARGTGQAGGTPPAQGTRPSGATVPAANTTPPPGATQPAAAAGAATATAAAGAGIGEVVVSSGDTIGSICERVKPTTMTVPDCVERVVALNNLANANDISVGNRLRVPQR